MNPDLSMGVNVTKDFIFETLPKNYINNVQ